VLQNFKCFFETKENAYRSYSIDGGDENIRWRVWIGLEFAMTEFGTEKTTHERADEHSRIREKWQK
jgi:hypothetical protein